jgi:hypothetical protein
MATWFCISVPVVKKEWVEEEAAHLVIDSK